MNEYVSIKTLFEKYSSNLNSARKIFLITLDSPYPKKKEIKLNGIYSLLLYSLLIALSSSSSSSKIELIE
jgi:hypothetical protein